MKRTLENEFIQKEDYKINVLPKERVRTGPDSETQFAHKKNAKRTLENNFTINEDYKLTVLPLLNKKILN